MGFSRWQELREELKIVFEFRAERIVVFVIIRGFILSLNFPTAAADKTIHGVICGWRGVNKSGQSSQ